MLRCPVKVSLFLVLPCLLAFQLFYSFVEQKTVFTIAEHALPATEEGALSTPNSRICPYAARLFNESEVARGIQQARAFHQQGGNIKTLQNYLDEQINPTLKRSGITFHPLHSQKVSPDVLRSAQEGNVTGYIHHFHENVDNPRGGYGQKLWELRPRDKTHEDRFIRSVEEPWSYDRWAASIGPSLPEDSCHNLVKIGRGYQGKVLCLPPPNLKDEAASTDSKCHVFSIGSNDQWGFETEFLQRNSHCHVHTFDCTLASGGPKNKPEDNRIHFYNYCISSNNHDVGNRRYRTYEHLYNVTGIQVAPQILKMDVEGAEFNVLTSMMRISSSFWPEQIAVEVHWATKMTEHPWVLRLRQAGELSLFFGMLFTTGGYLLAQTSFDKGCTPCLEVLLARAVC